MSYQITPMIGAGPFAFGMSPDQVRLIAGSEFRSFKRTPISSHACDYFSHLGIFANYNRDGELEAIEFASPARPILDGASLLESKFSSAKELLAKKDPDLKIEQDGAISYRLGIALYAPLVKEGGDDCCESLTVFAANYYD